MTGESNINTRAYPLTNQTLTLNLLLNKHGHAAVSIQLNIA